MFREQQPVVFLIYRFFFISQFIFKETLQCIVKKKSMEAQRVADKDRMTQKTWKSSSSGCRRAREFSGSFQKFCFADFSCSHIRHMSGSCVLSSNLRFKKCTPGATESSVGSV